MFGILIGTLSLVGLIKVLKWGRHGRWHGGGAGGPRRWMLRRLFEALDTTPGQEKVSGDAFDALRAKGYAVRDAFEKARRDMAQAMRAEHFDGDAYNAAKEAQRGAMDALEAQLKESLQAVHEALQPEQRKRLADFMEFGPRAFGHGRGCHGMHHGGHRHAAVNL